MMIINIIININIDDDDDDDWLFFHESLRQMSNYSYFYTMHCVYVISFVATVVAVWSNNKSLF